MLGITEYAWRLIPANPILLRVVETGGKRKRDLFIRCGYLGLLVALVVIALMSGSNDNNDLGSLAKTSAGLFQKMSFLQLGLVALLAPIFTAGAITQEKDSQTYDILLSTPLTNGQIVLGSLLSRLFFVVALLVSGIPIFSITQIFGGVAIKSIVLSFSIACATAFVTGALAMAIATFKVGTRRTIFSFYLFIVVYLAGGWVLDSFEAFHVPGHVTQQGIASHISWFTGLNPFLALRVIFNDPSYIPPTYDDLPANLHRWPIGWYLTNPTSFYISLMFFLSFVLVIPSILLLRRMAQSTTSLKTLVLQKLKIVSGDKSRKPRAVWSNPIAWREAKTKASAARATLLRYGFILAGVAGAVVLLVRYMHVQPGQQIIRPGDYDPQANTLTIGSTVYSLGGTSEQLQLGRLDPTGGSMMTRPFDLAEMRGPMEVVTPAPPASGYTAPLRAMGPQKLATLTVRPVQHAIAPDDARKYLLGMCIVELAVILLIVTNAAASTVTREKEDGTLDLLLSSPITSRYYIWGKLRGLVSFVLPLVAVPVASVLIFVIYDLIRRIGAGDDPTFDWTVFPEAVLLMPGMLIIVSAFAAILGMQMSLRCRTTVMAVMSSVGIVVGICAGMGWCGYQWLNSGSSGNWPAVAAGCFSPFTLMQMLIAPGTAGAGTFADITGEDMSGRVVIVIFTLIAIGAYTGIVWSMYTSMVKNFDMTIRRQSR